MITLASWGYSEEYTRSYVQNVKKGLDKGEPHK